MSLGRYELIDRIAVGGMAEIYLARATGIEGFEKLVVLKRILPQFATNKEFVTMFLDEARLSATLQHTNIAQVHDIGQHGGSYFFTMEYIRGEDVRAILKSALQQRKRIPLACSLTIVAGAAAGLHAAHEKCGIDGTPLDIVHRDVSPSNVLVSYDGGVKLVDFGVAKAAQRQHETQAGTLKGKVAYMSPEQCKGKALDRRSDIFALGILLYELTTHRRLFKGDSEFDIMSKIVKQDVEPPSITFGKYPKDLERILIKALKRDREERYATAQELQIDIEEFARKHAVGLSAVNLGSYMREMFVDQMREDEARIRSRPRTEEVELDIAIDSPDDEPSEVSDHGVEVERLNTPGRAASPDMPTVCGTRRQPTPVKRRRWPLLLEAAALAAAAAGVFAAVSLLGPEDSSVTPAEVPAIEARSAAAPALEAAPPTEAKNQKLQEDAKTAPRDIPALPAASAPRQDSPPTIPAATAPKASDARETHAAPAVVAGAETSAETDVEADAMAEADTETKADDNAKADAETEPARETQAPAKRARKPRSSSRRARATKSKSKARAKTKSSKRAVPPLPPKKKPKNWQLDSPLPPPRSK